MSFVKRLFSKKTEEDYETVLANLASDIQKRQLKLSEIRLRERRSTLLVTLYTLAAWVAYVSVWYLDVLPELYHQRYFSNPSATRAINAIPVVVGPIIVLFIRRIVQIWYQRKGDAEEKTIKTLIKQRRDKVEEIKAKTRYYSTRDLLQKYDDATPQPTPLRPRNQFPPPGMPITPQRAPIPGPNAPVNPAVPTPAATGAPGFQTPGMPVTPGPRRRQWYDKLADAILGEEDPNIGSPSTRYALICEKCFSHNGLVKETMWEDAQYVCPKCNHFNASARSKRGKPRASLSPPTSVTSSPSNDMSGLPPPRLFNGQPSTDESPFDSPPKPLDSDLPTVDSADAAPMDVDTSVNADSP